jgi:hypothetical protein
MRKLAIVLCAVVALAWGVSTASAETITLNDWTFNVNGTTFNPPPLPADFDTSLFNFATGLGTITIDYRPGAGAFSIIGYFDHDITGLTNGVENEFGYTSGTPAAGQSWELDDPGYGFWPPYVGDLVTNVLAGTLDNMIRNGAGNGPDDIGMALGWNFTIPDDTQRAILTFTLSAVAPGSGFYLNQHDPLPVGTPGEDIYFSSSLDITNIPTGVIPEPGTMLLLGTGLALAARRKLRNR